MIDGRNFHAGKARRNLYEVAVGSALCIMESSAQKGVLIGKSDRADKDLRRIIKKESVASGQEAHLLMSISVASTNECKIAASSSLREWCLVLTGFSIFCFSVHVFNASSKTYHKIIIIIVIITVNNNNKHSYGAYI